MGDATIDLFDARETGATPCAVAPEMSSDTWSSVVARASRGEREALEELLVRHMPRLRAFVRLRAGRLARAQDDSSDLVQSVCVEILTKSPRLRFENEAAFRHWLFTEATRKILKRARYHTALKRDARRAESLDSAVAACYSSFATPSEQLAAREQVERVELAFDRLEERERELVSLAYVVGLSRAEMGARLGLSEGAVRTALHRALARLASELDTDE